MVDWDTQLAPTINDLARTVAPASAALFLAPAPFAWWRARKERRLINDLRDLDDLRALDWHELELLVRAVYDRKGWRATRIGGLAADDGIDVMLKGREGTVLVQCKQWRSRQVPISVVRELLGAVVAEGADRGIVVTCGTFTGDAWGFARRNGVELVDGLALVKMVRQVRSPAVHMPAPAAMPGNADGPVFAPQPCPRCDGAMVQRKASSGRSRGQFFFGCTRFPTCKGTRPA